MHGFHVLGLNLIITETITMEHSQYNKDDMVNLDNSINDKVKDVARIDTIDVY